MSHSLVRGVITGVASIATFYFMYWIPFSILPGVGNLFLVPFLGSLAVAIVAGRYVWRQTERPTPALASHVVTGAVVTGAIGFVAGFFGPLLFAPDANQGPLLGLFITGPLGFLLGGIGGGIYWVSRGRPGA
jgi:hypothetical protein